MVARGIMGRRVGEGNRAVLFHRVATSKDVFSPDIARQGINEKLAVRHGEPKKNLLLLLRANAVVLLQEF